MKKSLKAYTPGKNKDDFLTFANTMNKNVLVDYKSNIRDNTAVSSPAVSSPSGAVATLPSSDLADNKVTLPEQPTTPTISTTVPRKDFSQWMSDNGYDSEQPTTPTISTTDPKKDFSQWMSDNGYDSERDYLQSKAALEYEYNTQLANYGANAERLYQMGLSNSGVSDVFGANAYSAYLSAQNDLYAQKIERDNQYRRDYNTYSEGYDSAVKQNNQSALAFASGIYDGYNLDYVQRALAANGYDQTAIDHVMTSLNTLGSDEIKAGTVQNLYGNIANAFPDYKGSDAEKQAILNLYGKTMPAEAINEAISLMDAALDVQNAQKLTELDEFLSTYAIDETGVSTWGATESEKAALKNMLVLDGYSEANAEYAIGVLDTRKTQLDAAAAKDMSADINNINVSDGSFTFDGLNAELADAKNTFGEDSQAYKDVQMEVSQKNKEAIEWILGGDEDRLGSSAAAAMLGIEGYADKKPGEQEGDVMNKAAELRKSGALTAEDYNAIVTEWMDSEIKVFMDEDTKAKGRGLGLKNYGAIVQTINEWRNNGAISDEEYSKYVSDIVDKVGLEFANDVAITWSNNDGANKERANITAGWRRGRQVTDQNMISSLESITSKSTSKSNEYVTMGGKLYHHAGHNWYEIDDPETQIDVRVNNTTDAGSKEGIVALIIAALEKSQKATTGARR